MSLQVGRSFLCSDSCTLSIIPMNTGEESLNPAEVSKFQSKIKVVIPNFVSENVSQKLSQSRERTSNSAANSKAHSMNLNEHASKSSNKRRVKAEARRATQIASIDVRVWDPKWRW